jgi:hypothetical protein
VAVASHRPPRLIAPAFLESAERSLFEELIAAAAAEHFVPTDLPLIISFVQATVAAQTTAGKPEFIKAWEVATRLQMALATKLRLTPHARMDRSKAGRVFPRPA